MNFVLLLLIFCSAFIASAVYADPLTIDLTSFQPAPTSCPYGPGTAKDPSGNEIKLDSRSFFLNGKPWVPILGEFHYSRYPQSEWREEMLKMKAAGINTVSTYVFWIHQEEIEGKYDWTGQRSLRSFLELCRQVGLKAFVRIGPWCHGEVRNGGFPDWVENSGTKLRTTDPAYLALVQPFYAEISKQMTGLLWKDGGPVIGVQIENECARPDYLLKLKSMAQTVGIDVPFYAITGWQGGLPNSGLIPLFGGYTDGFWGGSREQYRKEFLFTNVRALNNLGAQLTTTDPANSALIEPFPYACVEIGGGMAVGYDRRILIDPNNVAALALSKLGSGNNMPGYYMFQGGINPDGELTTLQEDHPNRLTVKDYDFQAPLGAAGQVREQYHLLRDQHLFLEDFGSILARMPPYLPDVRPSSLNDFDTLRWDVRSDGKSGFLFFDNQQPYVPLPDHPGVQFRLKTNSGSLLIPSKPVTIQSGAFGFWPVNLDCGGGVNLEYATAQPLCQISDGNRTVYFFTALNGIAPELKITSAGATITTNNGTAHSDGDSTLIDNIQAGTSPAATVTRHDGASVDLVVLTPAQALQFWRLPFGGTDRAMLSLSALIADNGKIRLESGTPADFSISIFPALKSVKFDRAKSSPAPNGVFSTYSDPRKVDPTRIDVSATLTSPAGPNAATLKGTDEASWSDAAVYTLNIPANAAGSRLVLNIHYIGDAARLYIGDTLYDDNFYNGNPFAIGLWRIPRADWPKITLKVLPYSDGLLSRLAQPAVDKVNAAKSSGTLNDISITSTLNYDSWVTP